ncbi:hypothetical protein YB2330_005184 [Saitoella coloradoensis]
MARPPGMGRKFKGGKPPRPPPDDLIGTSAQKLVTTTQGIWEITKREGSLVRRFTKDGVDEIKQSFPYVWRLFKLVLALNPRRTVLLVIGRFVMSILPSTRLRVQGAFIDLVQDAIDYGKLDRTRLLRLASLHMLIHVLEEAISTLLESSNAVIERRLGEKLDLELMKAHLKLDLVSLADPAVTQKFQDAERVCRSTGNGGFQQIMQVVDVFTSVTGILSQVTTLSGLVSRRLWPLVLISTLRPLLHAAGMLGGGVFGARITDPLYQRMSTVKSFATNPSLRQEIKVFGLSDWLVKEYEAASTALGVVSLRFQREEGMWSNVGNFVEAFTTPALYITTALQSQKFKISLGTLNLLQSTTEQIIRSTSKLLTRSENVVSNWKVVQAFFECCDMAPAVHAPSGGGQDYETAEAADGRKGMKIEARNVRFAYPGQPEVLHDINFTIQPGEMIAVVGYNGAGKSTIVKLLTRLFDCTSGELLLNGTDIREYHPDDLRKRTAVLFQDFGKFVPMTIRENIAVGNVPAAMYGHQSTIENAAKSAGAAPFVDALPKKYNTNLTKSREGHFQPLSTHDTASGDLSGGEWQKLALARGIFMRASQSDLLILDEPTASLDPKAEFDLFAQLREVRRERSCTTIFISHRFNTVVNADRIMVVEGGRVVEFGNHRELMEKDGVGRYRELYELSAGAFLEQEGLRERDRDSTAVSTDFE